MIILYNKRLVQTNILCCAWSPDVYVMSKFIYPTWLHLQDGANCMKKPASLLKPATFYFFPIRLRNSSPLPISVLTDSGPSWAQILHTSSFSIFIIT